ncbi:hypothetical protein OSTOST_06758 [Ostertagia ostertagi]
MIPQNYTWMIDMIKKKYDNPSSARANVINRLVSLRPAKQGPASCGEVIDEIRCLINEMISSGYRISDTQDPMWIETILKKFPRRVVEELLRESNNGESSTVGEILNKLDAIISKVLMGEKKANDTVAISAISAKEQITDPINVET